MSKYSMWKSWNLYRYCQWIISLYVEYQTVKMNFNLTYTPDYQNTSSNASQQLQLLINQTLNTALINVTNGGFRPDLVSIG